MGADRFAVVTGGSRGIGKAVAMGLARAGVQVLIVGQHQQRVDDALTEARSAGLPLSGLAADVSQPAVIERLQEATHAWPRVDMLVASAAVMSAPASKLVHTGADHWREILAVNLDGVFNSFAAFVPQMLERRQGIAIALSACLGRMSGPGTAGGLAPYRVSKAGVNALVRNTAAEVGNGRRGVYVDAVCPGHCRTDMGGLGAPRSADEGADTVLWLCGRGADGAPADLPTGRLWEDRALVEW
ncbi:MAG: SDR family oxidoreductase [Actinobacteria bacterium]|nr:SDR family oxidoreductase [Actinomycetota bacterium]